MTDFLLYWVFPLGLSGWFVWRYRDLGRNKTLRERNDLSLNAWANDPVFDPELLLQAHRELDAAVGAAYEQEVEPEHVHGGFSSKPFLWHARPYAHHVGITTSIEWPSRPGPNPIEQALVEQIEREFLREVKGEDE
jgi:hypothetical protein